MACPTSTPGAVDALVQGALVDLFNAYGVVLAPALPAREAASDQHEVMAAIGFAREGLGGESGEIGRLTLAMPGAVFELFKGDAGASAGRDDRARELTNQLMGRIKNRLLQLGATLQIGLPVICSGPQARLQGSAALQLYGGATPAGNVLVTLEGMPRESELSWVKPERLALEGDVIFF